MPLSLVALATSVCSCSSWVSVNLKLSRRVPTICATTVLLLLEASVCQHEASLALARLSFLSASSF